MGRPPDPKKRENILTAATALFLEKGYHYTTTLAIAESIKVSSCQMYTYFEDKEHLLVECVKRMEAEHIALSTELAKKCAGLDDDNSFTDKFYEAQATVAHRVRFIATVAIAPETAGFFNGFQFDYSRVFMPYLKDWPEKLAKDTAEALMAISISYFFMGDVEVAKSASLSVLANARNSLKSSEVK